MECGSVAEWLSGIGTILAVIAALFLAIGAEPLKRFVQRLWGRVQIRYDSQIEQLYQIGAPGLLKTRLKVTNNAPLSDTFKVFVTEIRGRDDFIEVPLVWMHGHAEGEKAATVREVGARESAWVDLVTVGNKWQSTLGMFLYLDLGAGVGVRSLHLLDLGKTELVLRIDPSYGKPVSYEVIVDWDGSYRHPEISYSRL